MSGRFVGVGRHLFQHQVLARSFFLLPCQALTRNTIVQTHIRRSSTTAKSQSRQKKHASPIHHIPEVDPEAIITLKAPIKIHVDEKGVALSVMLMQTHIERNNNKFYLMQVLEDENNPYEVVLWSRWGRVGVRGQTYSITKSKDATIKLFKQKFETKTGNSWDDLNNFKACPDKYVVVELGSKNPFVPPKPTQTEQEIPESKLPNKVQKLLALIFSERMMVQQMTQMGLDSKKLPFGKLSTTTIQNGFQALNQIAAELDSANPSQTILSQLSGLFYSFIPHNLGFRRMSDFVISDKIKLQQKVDMLQSLGEMEVAAQMMREARDSDSNSNPVDVHHSQLGCSIAPIPKTSETFQLVEKYVQNTHGPTHNQYTLRVEGVFKLSRSTNTTNTTTTQPAPAPAPQPPTPITTNTTSNEDTNTTSTTTSTTSTSTINTTTTSTSTSSNNDDDEFENIFSRARREIGNVMLLWHGSRLSNWVGILSQGLRIAPPEAPATGYMFGKGVYFTDVSSKSANYCHASPQNSRGLMMLCEVALGNSVPLLEAKSDADMLPPGHHSTKGVGKSMPKPSESVLLNNGTAVPLGQLVPTPDITDSALTYNEYIVYHTSQFRPRFLVQVRFLFSRNPK